jgi:hypothetical protein
MPELAGGGDGGVVGGQADGKPGSREVGKPLLERIIIDTKANKFSLESLWRVQNAFSRTRANTPVVQFEQT